MMSLLVRQHALVKRAESCSGPYLHAGGLTSAALSFAFAANHWFVGG